ncbi:hypothetical protein Kpol_1028p9 [Vanderwaltozyma polyspora DSM 70294]|uniref:NTF2 domain-containing protein n=1 Tax=Vanderwaltozyma polyspora (strain ATCC 22028 / DSM 70294 / BCRC 21397 / CBS 2163 / NBRC 10782 / NRRL Y-8283 / UCD 57-17) TaxID=436907 RepID=A7TFY0_VANPO|nr:uncharacterized protein Kpol_1028p9 [Vanderwaltozyma polyspora DSM 70294]EDO18737.1 hypothetical protein Kpol_1028p9 [Vanderwaltozyma polyspora DSM 70294]
MTATVVEIGHLFLKTYYERMSKDPSKVSALYSNTAELTHINYQLDFKEDLITVPTVKITGKENISKFFTRNNKKVCDLKVKIDSCDIQSTGVSRSGVIILTTGELFWTGTPTYRFCQTFVLERIENNANALDIVNDIIRFIPEPSYEYQIQPSNSVTSNKVENQVAIEETVTKSNDIDVEESKKDSAIEVSREDSEIIQNEIDKSDEKTEPKDSTSFTEASTELEIANTTDDSTTSVSGSSPVPVKISWASKLASVEHKTTEQPSNKDDSSDETKQKASIDKKSSEFGSKENNNSRSNKKKQMFSTVNKDGFYPIYIRGTAGVSEEKLKSTLEKEFGTVMKITNADNFAVVDFELQKSQTEALEKRKIKVEDIEVHLERKTLRKSTSTSPVSSNTSRQHKKHYMKKRD